MKPAAFSYFRPASLQETFDLLDRYGDDGRILAGGQSLVPALNMRLATPAALIDINRIPGLAEIRQGPDGLVIGALCRHAQVLDSPLVAAHASLIAQAMPHVGHAAIRSRGTIGGSVALADPAAELPACLVALEARIRATSRRGTREIPAPDFFRGIYTTALVAGEIVTEVVVPAPSLEWRSRFVELARRHGDFALVGLAVHTHVDGALRDSRLVFSGVGSAPVRARGAEGALRGRPLAADVIAQAQKALTGDLDPPSDVHASAALRLQLARVLLARALSQLTEG